MSHGASTEGAAAEPNLVPLLDMVMQLLMFFMISVNFVTEQINENIQLPIAQSARPMDKNDVDVLFLNLNRHSHMEVVGQSELDTLPKMGYYLAQQYQDLEQIAKTRSDGKVKTTVILRADKNVDYETVFKLLEECKKAGFRKLQLRAMTKA